LGKSYVPKLPKAVIEYEVRDKNGKLLSKGKLPAKSWVGNIIGLLSSIIASWQPTNVSSYVNYGRADLLDTGNTSRGLLFGGGATTTYLGGSAPAGDTTAGILVGTSDTPVSLGQYNLQSPIAHGTGPGQLIYGATTVETLVKDTTWYFRVIRIFTNNSGASITVREIGLFVKLGITTSPYYFSCMLARDVLVSPITVPNGSTLTVRYIISHSLS
jgi:hypothetical protein